MPIERNTRHCPEQPPSGGIFLPKNQFPTTPDLLTAYPLVVGISRRAQAVLAESDLSPGSDLSKKMGGLCVRYVKEAGAERKLREALIIDMRASSKAEKQRIQHALYADTREVLQSDRKKWQDWLGTAKEQKAYLQEKGVAIDYEPPQSLLKAEMAYSDRFFEEAHREGDIISLIKQRAGMYIQCLIREWPDMAMLIGRNDYEVTHFPFDKSPYLMRDDGQDPTVHFTDAGFPPEDYDHLRHASTQDYVTLLEDCLIEFS